MESKLAEVKKLRQEGDAAGALDVIEAARRESPDELALADLAAEIHLGAGELELAVRAYEGFLERNPSNPKALNNYACMLLEARRPKQAVENLLKAFELEESNVDIQCNLAQAFKDLGLIDEATKVCEKLLELNSNEPRPHYILELEIAESGWKPSATRFRVGKVIHLLRRNQPIWEGAAPVYASRIEELRPDRLIVSAPEVDDILVPFPAGSRIILGYKKKKSFWGCVVEVAETPEGGRQILLTRPRRMRKVQKRKHFRILWPGLLREATLKSVPEGHEKPDIDDDDVVEQDVSATGMSLLANAEVVKGSVFDLTLGSEDDELTCDGTVVRCKQISPGGFEIGLQFTGLSHEDQDRIAGFVFGKRLEKNM